MMQLKMKQGFIEQDIQRIEHMIRNALIIEDTGDNNTVQIGKTVTFVELPGDERRKLSDCRFCWKQTLSKVKFQMNLQWHQH